MIKFKLNAKSNNQGFTLLEGMTSLLVLSFLTLMWMQLLTIIVKSNELNQESIQLSLLDSRMRSDFRACKSLNTKNNALQIKLVNGDLVTYEPYEDKIIRKVNNRGYEPVLKLGDVNLYNRGTRVYLKKSDEHYLGRCYE